MARKAVTDGGKRDEIIAAAMECFFEKGYDGTTVRSIMKKAGGEIGLFYYYFDSKDEVFDRVLDRFFAGYEKEAARIAGSVYRDPFRALTRFFWYMIAETERFRETYGEKLHRTVRWAIREHTLTLIVPYIRQILEALVCLGARPPLELDVTAIVLAHGVGSTILHEDSDWMKRRARDARKASNVLMGLDPDQASLMFPEDAGQDDIPRIADLAGEMPEQFPGFVREDFEAALEEAIGRREVLVIRCRGSLAGCIAFSRQRKEINFLSVAPAWRKRGVASRLLITAMSELPAESELSVVTYREGNPLGVGARRLYERFGFREGQLLTVFDYPCQRLLGTAPACLPALEKNQKG